MKKVAEKFVFLEYFLYLCTINKIRIKYIRDIMINFSKFNSLYSVATYFNTEEKCQQAIVESRWGDDVVCPYCGKHHCHKRADGRFCCSQCHKNFSEKVDTIFENTKIDLRKWFMAMYLISSHKKGISSHQLARDIDVTQKTAWFILQKIRTLFAQDDTIALEGDVECDEAYIGGREKNKHESRRTPGTQGRSTKTKTPVFGMVQRGGKVIAVKCEKTDGATLLPLIGQFIAEGSNVYTDELNSYNGIDETKYTHKVVNHGRKEYVKGGDFTNTIEGFWGTLKRMIEGIYHSISSKYLQRYVDEAVYRYNCRKMKGCDCFRNMFAASIGVVDYKMVKLVA